MKTIQQNASTGNVQHRPLPSSSVRTNPKTAMAQAPSVGEDGSNPAFDIPLCKKVGVIQMRITPEIAQNWLKYNVANREITKAKLEQFKRDMLSGEWTFTGDPIRFAPGKLLDGQHRLMAALLTSTPFIAIVVFGLDAESQANMDTGRNRTPRDVLMIEGLEKWQAQTVGAALHTIIAVASGLSLYSSVKCLNRQIRDFYLEHTLAIKESLRVVQDLPRTRPVVSHSRLLVMHYLLAKMDKGAADEFVVKVATGDGVARTSPIFILRQKLLADQIDRVVRSEFEMFYMLVKTWNTVRKGLRPQGNSFLRIHDGAEFPEIAQ